VGHAEIKINSEVIPDNQGHNMAATLYYCSLLSDKIVIASDPQGCQKIVAQIQAPLLEGKKG
jgi:hypothetical protein